MSTGGQRTGREGSRWGSERLAVRAKERSPRQAAVPMGSRTPWKTQKRALQSGFWKTLT